MTVYIVFREYTPFAQKFDSIWSTREAALRQAHASFTSSSTHDYAIVRKCEVDQTDAYEIIEEISASDAMAKQGDLSHG